MLAQQFVTRSIPTGHCSRHCVHGMGCSVQVKKEGGSPLSSPAVYPSKCKLILQTHMQILFTLNSLSLFIYVKPTKHATAQRSGTLCQKYKQGPSFSLCMTIICFFGTSNNYMGTKDYTEKHKHYLPWIPTKMAKVWGVFTIT